MKFGARMEMAADSVPSHSRGVLSPRDRQAFSIVELLVATVILALILGIIFSITQMISQSWGKSTAKIEAFQGARTAFDTLSRQISQATLNTYYDYFDGAGNTRASYGTNTSTFVPDRYGRFSDLHFVSGKALVPNQIGHSLFFLAPLGYTDDASLYGGLDALLTGCGFFVSYDKDNSVPGFLATLPNKPADRYRFRLMQYLQPSQDLKVYDPAATDEKAWFTTPLASDPPPVSILTENIVAFVVLPKLSRADAEDAISKGKVSELAADFEYDTRKVTAAGVTDYQLPPVVEVVMVAIDEVSAQRLCLGNSTPDLGVPGGLSNLFQDASLLETDLKKLTDALIENRAAYRVFRSEIALRGAKWSSSP
jgi:uncharacterized protein (TIGR02599 family)